MRKTSNRTRTTTIFLSYVHRMVTGNHEHLRSTNTHCEIQLHTNHAAVREPTRNRTLYTITSLEGFLPAV